jgi:F-box protein 20
VKDRRKTVVEVCEKVIFDGHGKIGTVKSPPATPYIEVPNTRVIPLQEPEQLKQETLLLNDGVDSGEHAYIESYSVQQAPSDTSVLNVNMESITQEENNVFKGYNNVQQLPSSEFFSQHVPSDKEEEKSLPVLSSLLLDGTEDVFLPVNASQQIPQLNLSSDVEIVSELSFPLGPPTSTEPPKEKPPPPPPEEISDEELLPVTNLKREDSTKRIKKELRRKRSDFLGIEGGNDDSYLEPELTVAPPPDMTTFLVEERRSEQQLYRQSICSETDSNHGETTSRDSGVELDRAQSDDWPGKLTPQILSAQHSRQNSDIYGTASVTSEEDEIIKREREILESLEKEEQWRYSSNTNSGGKGIGEKLTVKLLQLEQENKRLERERSEEENKRHMKENACREEDLRLRAKEQELKQQEEALQAERERLQRENEELQRQKQKLQHHESPQLRHTHSQMHQLWGSTTALPQQWTNESTGLLPTHLSLQDISRVPTGNINSYNPPTSPMAQSSAPLNYRLSLPDLQQEEQLQSQQFRLRPSSMMSAAPHRPPPPIPPAKPLRAVSQEQRERENSIRNSRMPSADSVPQHVESTHVHHSSVPAHNGAQPLSRQTLQALSAVPRSRFISNDMWMQAKKKPENQRSGGRESAYNYQHWLIQEAEHRRITEQQQRTAATPRKTSPPHLYPNTPSWNTLQPQPRQEKPLPDAIIQTLTQRVQNRVGMLDSKSSACPRRRLEDSSCRDLQSQTPAAGHIPNNASSPSSNSAIACGDPQEKMLSVSGKKKCSHCGEELGRGAAMIIESLRLFYHIDCFKCCVCHVQLGDGLMGTDVRVRNNKLHCHNCYSSDDGVKFSCV